MNLNWFRALLLVSPILLALASCSGGTRFDESEGTGADWPNAVGGYDEIGFSRLQQINDSNVDQLGLEWSLDLDDEITLEATPLAVDGVIYITGGTSSVYAVDGKTGELLWKHDPELWKVNPASVRANFRANRGAAYADGRVFAAALDGHLMALDAKSGELLWSTQTLPENTPMTTNGAPRVFNDKVIIGNGGADYGGVRGYVTAYEQKTGEQAWRFYITPGSPEENAGDPAMEAAAKTWGSGEYWKTGTGGTAWNGMTFDEEANRIYIGTGNGGPINAKVRDPDGGDNLFLTSIVAVDADTGKYIWHYQINPRDTWDYKATANILMTTLEIDGEPRKVLMQAPTNGFFYVLDRDTGKPISAEKIGKVDWAERIDLNTGRPIERKGIRHEQDEFIMYPSPLGAHNWQAMSYSPQTGLVYIPYMQLGGHFSNTPMEGALVFDGLFYKPYMDGPGDGRGALVAWDPVAQKERWRKPIDTIWNGGTLTTAGNLVFQGTGDGYFSAYDAASGKRLWRFNAGLGIVSAPMSFEADDKQYVSVLVGYGGTTSAISAALNAGWKYGQQTRRLLTFAIGGKAALPAAPPRDTRVYPVDDPDLVIDMASAQRGEALSWHCMGCHGPLFKGAGSPGPDLRESHLALDPEAFYKVVHDGALLRRGMPKFEEFSLQDVNDIYMYLRAAAREEKASGATAKPSK